ncbi:BT2A2 protein, partial [Atractosteus spatula]|nr:BT2A2 protein [Atractosteus spatula]
MDASCILFLFPETFQVLGPAGPVVATVGEDTVLPCYLSPSISVLDLEIRWFRGDFSKPLFLYLNHRPRLQNQNPFYKGRTDLFPEEFPSGNASLFLKSVRGTDDGQYTCMVKSTNWYEEAVIDVAVRGVGTQPSVSLHSNEGGQTQLVCRSEGWFRNPAVNWTDKDGQDVTSQSSTTVERDRQGLLSVSSYIPVKQESNIFSCLVRSTVPQLDLGSELHIPRDFSPGPSGWMVALILTLFLSAGAAALLIINWRKLHVQLFLLYLQLSLTVQLADSSYLVPDQQYKVESRQCCYCTTVEKSWFRKPAVNWTDKDGQDVTSLSSTTVERDRQGLLSVSSYIPVKQESNIFSCLVRSTVPQLDLGSELHIPNFRFHSLCYPYRMLTEGKKFRGGGALGTHPSVSLHSTGGGQTQLVCRSEGWFPAPAVNWTDRDGQDETSLSSTTVERDSRGLLSVSSYLPVKQESNIFSCLVRSAVPYPDRGSLLHISGNVFPDSLIWLVALISTAVLWVMPASFLIHKWRRLHDMVRCCRNAGMRTTHRLLLLDLFLFTVHLQYITLHNTHADMTLDPDTVQHELLLSGNGKRVRGGRWRDLPDSRRRFQKWSCVVSKEGFSAGQHYWEVKVNKEWTIGIAAESAPRKGAFAFTPGQGYWTLAYNRHYLSALTAPLTPLSRTLLPRTLGVFLDIEERRVSFYKVESREHIYTFSDMAFNEGEKLFPLFRTIDTNNDLVIKPSRDHQAPPVPES